ncbi:MAG: TlyA family RNA methyltransferase [Acidimicrobiales bacterium]
MSRRASSRGSRRRLDVELVRRGLVPSREAARAAIEAGRIIVSGTVADRPSRLVSTSEPVRLLGDRPRFVSRGGHKLDAALERFDVDVAAKRVIDAGASTGGFTDAVLQRGAAEVVAVDVGHGQLHERLRANPHVVLHECTNVRTLGPEDVGGPADVVVADLSFISLRTVAPALVGLTRAGGDLVVLVKPQFEAGRTEAAKGSGVIRDPEVWRRVLAEVCDALDGAGAAIMGAMVSPLRGADGNVEFLLHARAGAEGQTVDLDAVVAAAKTGLS